VCAASKKKGEGVCGKTSLGNLKIKNRVGDNVHTGSGKTEKTTKKKTESERCVGEAKRGTTERGVTEKEKHAKRNSLEEVMQGVLAKVYRKA